ncbi:MAG: single-stranded-DNA-specific exonuclease RecJ [Moorellales bacterium]
MDWRWLCSHPGREEELAGQLGISVLLARLLINRGQREVAAARVFLEGTLENLQDSMGLPGMTEAVAVLTEAVSVGRRVLVYGDYDVDGVTATAVVLSFLRDLGVEAGYYLPDRLSEGYGLHREALGRARSLGYDLVVTVDCGLAAEEEVAWALEDGWTVVITDHHRRPPRLPPAQAVVYPPEGENLSGVGVAYHLVRALARQLGCPGKEEQFLDLVALGTVADSVPLLGDSRILVRSGLERLAQTEDMRPGLRSLAEVSGVVGRRPDPRLLSFTYIPRLNAPGRVGRADLALKLLLASSEVEARELAQAVERLNQERQTWEARMLLEAREQGQEFVSRGHGVLVLASSHWHPGVVGIVAGRLAEEFGRPVILLAVEGEEARGSGRSVVGLSLYDLLSPHRDLFSRFGGHDQAVGLSLPANRVEELRSRLAEVAGEGETGFGKERPVLLVEAEVSLREVNEELGREITRLEPFGEGNPPPILGVRGVRVEEARAVGREGEHLRLIVEQDGERRSAIGFGLGAELPGRMIPEIDLAFHPMVDHYNGERRTVLRVVAWRPALAGRRAPVGVGSRTESGSLSPEDFFSFWEEFARRFEGSGRHWLVGVPWPPLVAYLVRWLRETGVEVVRLASHLRRKELETLMRRLDCQTGRVLVASSGLLSQHAGLLASATASALILSPENGTETVLPVTDSKQVQVVRLVAVSPSPRVPAYRLGREGLRKLVGRGHPLLVYVRGWERAEAVAERLRGVAGKNQGEIGVYHHHLPPEAKQEVFEGWRKGRWQILVGTPAAALIGGWRADKEVVFLYPPFSLWEYALCSLGAVRAYLAWPPSEEEANERFLRSLWPPASVWRTLVEGKGPEKLRAVPSPVLRVAMAVMEELGGKKASLAGSWRYAEAKAAWEAWRGFLSFVRACRWWAPEYN